jgi:AraC-like DNA-binding protein
MSIFYLEEHVECVHYQQNPLVKIWSLEKGQRLEFEIKRDTMFLFVRRGCISITYAEYSDEEIDEERILLLPVNSYCIIEVKEDAEFLSFVLDFQVTLCENFSLVQLFPYYSGKKKKNPYMLTFNQQMRNYIHTLARYVADGSHCVNLYHLKKQELFFLFRLYYTKEELASFFYPILNKQDLYFKKTIIEKCLSAKNVQELAALVNYSTSGFIKKFERSFGESPYKWMCSYKATHILQDIKSEKLSFKQICEKYNFSSMPHFIQFCKKQYGITPGKLRETGNNL